MTLRNALALLPLSWLLAAPSSAAIVEGERFDERLTLSPEVSLALCSAELLRYKVVFRGYVAALYFEAEYYLQAVVTDANGNGWMSNRIPIEFNQ